MNDVREDLKAFVDGELTAERMAEVQAAVDADPELQKEVSFMKALGFEIRRLAQEPKVEGRAKALSAVRSRKAFWLFTPGGALKTAFGLGCAALIWLAFIPFLSRSGEFSAMDVGSSPSSSAEMAAENQFSRKEWDGGGALSESDAEMERAKASTDDFNARTPAAGESPQNSAAGAGRGLYSPNLPNAPAAMPQAQGGAQTKEAKPEESAKRSDSTTQYRSRSEAARMVIQNADLRVKVESVETAMDDALKIALSVGGFVENSSSTNSAKDLTGLVIIRVPSGTFETVLKRLGELGERIGPPNVNSVDVTKQYADFAGRLKVLHAEEDSYVTMLRGARKIGEILEIKDRLSQVRQEIQSLEEQRIALKDQSMLSTITAQFEQKKAVGEPAPPQDWAEETWAGAVNGMKSAGRFLGQVLIVLFVYAPLWLPATAVAYWLVRKSRVHAAS